MPGSRSCPGSGRLGSGYPKNLVGPEGESPYLENSAELVYSVRIFNDSEIDGL